MNRVFRLVWSQSQNAWVAVAETSKGRGKSVSSSRRLAALLAAVAGGALLAPSLSMAGPVGGAVTSGAAQIAQSGSTTTVTQQSQNASLTWKSFNVGTNETVNFAQPNATSIAVNRIYDTNGSAILGKLNANGQVFLINPNGVMFGAGAQVNVGSLVASTLDVSDASLGSSSLSFSGSGTGSVVNQGTINAADGGYVALIGNKVGNQGVIGARLGTVALAAGTAATLNFGGNQLLSVAVDQSTLNNLAENSQLIQADGGRVFMSAGAKDSVLASAVNNTGIVEARTVENKEGTIVLLAGMAAGTTTVSGGKLDASAPASGNGGFIETSAHTVKLSPDAVITTLAANGKTGNFLIDPDNYNIGGGDSDESGAALADRLALNNVTIQTTAAGTTPGESGDINVNEAVSWSTNSLLTLDAYRHVNVNADINASGASSALTMQAGSSGTGSVNTTAGTAITLSGNNAQLTATATNGAVNVRSPITMAGSDAVLNLTSGSGSVNVTGEITLAGASSATNITTGTGEFNATNGGFLTLQLSAQLTIDTNPYTIIGTLGALQALNGTTTGFYALGRTVGLVNNPNFDPLGLQGAGWAGTFEGLGNSLVNLRINTPNNYNGIFAEIAPGGRVQNIVLSGANVIGGNVTGVLAGLNLGTIRNATVTGATVTGVQAVGGLVGWNQGTIIGATSAAADVTATAAFAGGLAGENTNGGIINGATSSGTVDGATLVGGLVGVNETGSTITGGSSTSTVDGTSDVGGFVGLNRSGGTINGGGTATGAVTGVTNVGGFVGTNDGATSIITGGASIGTVNGQENVGGFAGLQNGGTIRDSNSSSIVIGTIDHAGGFVGYNQVSSTVTGSSSTGTVDGNTRVGGFVGTNSGSISTSRHTNGLVTSTGGFTGGFAGENLGGGITTSWATSNVNGDGEFTGGFAGINSSGTISQSYATGNVSGTDNFVGGLVGGTDTSSVASVITDTYATGNVTGGGDNNGGLVGWHNSGTVANSYSSGTVTSAASNNGGFIGQVTGLAGAVTNGYWNTGLSGTIVGVGAGPITGIAGLDAAQSQLQSSYTGFDFNPGTGIWKSYDTFTAPLLKIFLTDLLIDIQGGTINYGGPNLTDFGRNVIYTVGGNVTQNFSTLAAFNNGTLFAPGGVQYNPYTNAINASTTAYQPNPTAYSSQQGYNVTVTYPLGGSGGALTINPATLTAMLNGTYTKVYDQTTGYVLNSGNFTVNGVAAGDTVTISQNAPIHGDFNSSHVGAANLLTLTNLDATLFTLGGAAAGNYILPSGAFAPITAAGSITPFTVTASILGATNKVYDGNTAVTAQYGLATPFSGDVLTVSGSAALGTKDVGTAKAVNATGLVLGGAAAGDYQLASTSATANVGVVTAKTVNVAADAAGKTYDGLTSTTAQLSTNDFVLTDDISFGGSTANFDNKNAGLGKTVTVNGVTLAGVDANNYVLATTPITDTADITPKTLNSVSVANDKVYDGTNVATSAVSTSDMVAGDSLTLTRGGTFDDKNAATGKTVTFGGLVISGNDAQNYVAGTTGPATDVADITPATLTYNAAPATVNTGTTPSGLTGTVTGFVAGETVDTATTGTLTWTTPATATSPIGSYAIIGGGLGAQNYVFEQSAGSASALTIAGLGTTIANLVANQVASAQGLMGAHSIAHFEPGTKDSSDGVPRSSPAKFSPLDFVTVRADERPNTLSRLATATEGGMRLPADRLTATNAQ